MHDLRLDYEGFGRIKVKPKFLPIVMKFRPRLKTFGRSVVLKTSSDPAAEVSSKTL